MRRKVTVKMPLHVVRRSMQQTLSVVWIVGEFPAAFQMYRPRTKDGKWKGGSSFGDMDEVIDAVHGYVARKYGRDRYGPRFMTIDEADDSPFPYSAEDVAWAESILAESVKASALVPPTDAHIARRIVFHQKKRAKLCRISPQTPSTNGERFA